MPFIPLLAGAGEPEINAGLRWAVPIGMMHAYGAAEPPGDNAGRLGPVPIGMIGMYGAAESDAGRLWAVPIGMIGMYGAAAGAPPTVNRRRRMLLQ